MKLKVDAAKLREACAAALAERGSKLEMLRHAHLKAADGVLTFTTTDTQKMRAQRLEAEVQEPGLATCEPLKMAAALSGISGEAQLTLTEPGKPLEMKLPGKRVFKLESLAPEEFPLWAPEDMKPIEKLDAAQFLKAVERVRYPIDGAEARFYLRGMCLADGWAMGGAFFGGALYPLEADLPAGGVNIPVDSLPALAEACCGDTGFASFKLCETGNGTPSGFQVDTPEVTVTTRLIDMRFPVQAVLGYRKQLNDATAHFTLDPAALLQALDRLRPFCAVPGSKHSVMTWAVEGEALLLKSRTGSAADQVELKAQDGAANAHGAINPEYLRMVCNVAKGAAMAWHWRAADAVNIFTMAEREDMHFLAHVQI